VILERRGLHKAGQSNTESFS